MLLMHLHTSTRIASRVNGKCTCFIRKILHIFVPQNSLGLISAPFPAKGNLAENSIQKRGRFPGSQQGGRSDVLRDSAHKLIEQSIHVELAVPMNTLSGGRLEEGWARPLPHRHLSECEIITDFGTVPVNGSELRSWSR